MKNRDAILDALMPQYTHKMYIERTVDATPEEVYRAIQETDPREMRLASALAFIRTFGRSAKESPPETFGKSAEKFGMTPLAEENNQELVGGLIGQFWHKDFGIYRTKDRDDFLSFWEPGYVKVVSNFRVQEIAGTDKTKLSAEMRTLATSPDAEAKFRVYWYVLNLGIRLYMLSGLAAFKRHAERRHHMNLGVPVT